MDEDAEPQGYGFPGSAPRGPGSAGPRCIASARSPAGRWRRTIRFPAVTTAPWSAIVSHDTYLDGVPWELFARMRATGRPLWVDEPDGAGFWALTRHRHVFHAGVTPRDFSCARGIRLEELDDEELEARRTMMEYDGAGHARLRRLVGAGFSRKSIAAREDAVRALAASVVRRALERGESDFVANVARELPIRMLCRMLGVPGHDADALVEWGDALISNADPELSLAVVDQVDTDAYRLLPFRSPAAVSVFDYASRLRRERLRRPREDILSAMLHADAGGRPLTELEFQNFFLLLIVAGNETTRHTLSLGLLALIEHPRSLRELAAAPGSRPLFESATEEILRWTSVTMHFRRTLTRDLDWDGASMRAGDKAVLWYIAANRDDEVFADPDDFDLRRKPNRHLAFGAGRHFCLGAWLARLEVRVLLEELFRRVRSAELAGPPDRLRSNFIHGLKRLPVRFQLR